MKYSIFVCVLTLCLFSASCKNGDGRICNLKCEYMINPEGIDASSPRLMWQMKDEDSGSAQSAFRLIVGTDSLEVASGKGRTWDTGKLKTWKSVVEYHGKALSPFTSYFWRVKVWNQKGKLLPWSPVASFGTGMMAPSNWKGEWISDSRDISLKPAACFRKVFETGNRTVRSAKAYTAAAGLFELYINGEKAGDHRLDPMFTRYDRRILYVTHDVTKLLRQGKNAIGVLLGNGWYNLQSTAVWYFDQAPWRARPKFCLDLHIEYSDGSKEIISSARDWKTGVSPVTFNSIYTGEHVDGRMARRNWSMPDFTASEWGTAIPVSAPSQNICAQVLHPIRDVDTLKAVNMIPFSNKRFLFDFGQNISGVSQLSAKGAKGTTLRLIHAERIDSAGRADISNIVVHYRPTNDKDPFQTDVYTLAGTGEEVFRPLFNYKGFRYVEVISDQPVTLNKESLIAYFMHSDVPVAGSVSSSNPTLDKIWQATNNSYLSNLFGFPTDCPQREKNGWTGDSHIAIETALYNFDGITIYEKWLADHRDEQQPNGVLPAIIPTSGWGYTWANGPDWTSSIAIIPWNIYLFYGDTRLLQQTYENIKRYVDRITEESPDGLTSWGLGDWVPVKSVTPKEFTSSVYYYVDADILAKTAGILGNEEDHRFYSQLADKIKNAVNNKYLNPGTGVYGSGLQTELSVPLCWGLVPGELKEKVAANLAERVKKDGKHIDVGLLGSKTILNALSQNGYADLAYEVALQETYPSWGWWIVNGATTLYENWDISSKNDISLNHIMFGEIGAWFYKALGGIFPDPEHPGFRNILLKPNFVNQLEHFRCSHESPYGTIISEWKREKEKVNYKVTIPANSTATLTLPSAEISINGKKEGRVQGVLHRKVSGETTTFELKAGSFAFTIILK
jgi:alpha-L-rhamnosidase